MTLIEFKQLGTPSILNAYKSRNNNHYHLQTEDPSSKRNTNDKPKLQIKNV